MIGFINISLQDMNPSRGIFGKPYDSTQGISAKGKIILFLIIIAFGLYIGFRVWRSLKNEKEE